MASKDKKTVMFSCDYVYTADGSPSGLRYIAQINELLKKRELPFICDSPTAATGNCLPLR